MSDGSGCQCEKCGVPVSITAVLCKKCNEEVSGYTESIRETYEPYDPYQGSDYCSSCGEIVDGDEPTCPYCGEELND